MATYSSSGTVVNVSATLPATYDQSGFEALTFTKVGKTVESPDLDGAFDTDSVDLLDGVELKKKGIFRAGDGTLDMVMDDSDAGQAILEANIGESLAFQSVIPGGATYYRLAILKGYRPTGFDGNSIVRAEAELEFYEGQAVKVTS